MHGPIPKSSFDTICDEAEKLLTESDSDPDLGQAHHYVEFYVAAALHLFIAISTGSNTNANDAAMCASHVTHIFGQCFDSDEVINQEKNWHHAVVDAVLNGEKIPNVLLAISP